MTKVKSPNDNSGHLKLFPLPYFSISKAAEQIGVPESYIEESITCGLVRPCILFDSREPIQSSAALVGCDNVLSNIEVRTPSVLDDIEEVIGVNPLSKVSLSNIDELVSTNASQAVVIDFAKDELGVIEIDAYLHGFWQLGGNCEAVELMNSTEEQLVSVFPYVDECWYQELDAEPGEVRVLGFHVNVTRKQLVISYLDTYRMLEAYNGATPMKDMGLYGVTQLSPSSERKPRKPADQALAVICGLIASHPKFGKEYLDKPSELYQKLEHQLAKGGISLNSYFPTQRSFSRWLQGDYRSSLSL